MGFIITAAMYAVNISRMKARDVKRVADIEQIRKAIDIFREENGRYPGRANNSHLQMV